MARSEKERIDKAKLGAADSKMDSLLFRWYTGTNSAEDEKILARYIDLMMASE